MNLEGFFEDFDLYADCPNAVAKLRELILELAVRGKLVEHLSGWCTDDGKPFFIPDAWEWKTVGDVANVVRGITFPGSVKSKTCGDGLVACLRTASIQNEIDWDDMIYVPEEFVGKDEQWVRVDDVMISMANSYELVGKVALVKRDSVRATFGGFIAAVRPLGGLDSGFLMLYLRSPGMQLAFRESSSQTTNIANISLGRMKPLPFPLPPLEEQKRIVAKVDELMALCDALEAQAQAREQSRLRLSRAALATFAEAPTPANLELLFHPDYAIDPADLRKTILTLAVQGKLVEPFGKRDSIPLGEILAEASFNGVSKSPVEDSSATEVLKISAGTSRKDFTVDESDYKFVDLSEDEIEKSRILPGDLLACRYNGNLHYVGRFSIYKGLSGRVQVNPDKLIRFRVDSKSHDPMYVCYAMNSAVIRTVIESMCSTTAGNIGLSAGKMKMIEIPLPPLAEQKRIVAKVEELMGLVDRLEADLARSRETATRLMEAATAELLEAA